jgi:hypothetical protein
MTEQPDEPRQVIWHNTMDQGAWIVKVERTGARTGELIVIKAADDSEVLREKVFLAYEAIFGPDVDDVMQWENRCIEVVDAHMNPER